MNSVVFNENLLGEKFSKLNSTQQCIETLSHLCIFHRDEAELVVATWDRQFHKSEMVQKVPLLYLANDILQNSKRKGNEFVSEFWKVLPAALKDVSEKGDDHGKSVVSRLVDIWEQRRVFGSRHRSLKEVMLGEESPPALEFSKKRSRSVRIVKRDSRSIRTKLSIGGTAEKIVSAFHLVLSENSSEDVEMNKCKSAVHRMRKMEEDVDMACTNAKDPKRKTLAKELEEEENLLKQCIEKLKLVEANRVALVSQLRAALHEQESELENVRTQMQVAQAQVEEASNMQNRLNDGAYVAVPKSANTAPSQVDANAKSRKTSKKTAAAIAAEVADKLAASSSSQYIMSSVLSTFAAEEAKKAALTNTSSTVSNSLTSSMPSNPVANSMPRPENSMPVSDPNTFMAAQPLTAPPNNLYQSVSVPISQTQYQILPNPLSQQYMQQTGVIMTPYSYGLSPPLPPGPPPPPPLMPHLMSPMMPMNQQTFQMTQHQSIPAAQQPPAPPSFRPLQPPGMVYYGHPHHS